MSKTRVVQVRLIISAPPPHIKLPMGVSYPLPPETRDWLFSLMDAAHVIRMDVTQISPGEFEGLRSSGWPMRPKKKVDWWFIGVWVAHIVLILGGFALLAMLLGQCIK